MPCRNCKECPWIKNNNHSVKFRKWSEKMREMGRIQEHGCHMKTSDVWGINKKIDKTNLCVGHKQYIDNKNKENNVSK